MSIDAPCFFFVVADFRQKKAPWTDKPNVSIFEEAFPITPAVKASQHSPKKNSQILWR